MYGAKPLNHFEYGWIVWLSFNLHLFDVTNLNDLSSDICQYIQKEHVFFFRQLKQTHTNSVSQTGSSASMWTTKDGCCLTLCDRLSALEFCVHDTWMISELKKLSFRVLISSKQFAKHGHSSGPETVFTNWEQFVANVTWNWRKFLIHFIAQSSAFTSAWKKENWL